MENTAEVTLWGRLARLKAERDRALADVKLKSLFLTDASHELRTLFGIIFGYVEILETQLAACANPTCREAINAIVGSSERLSRVVDSILDLSRIESGRFEMRSEQIDLKALLDTQLCDYRPLAEKKGLVLTSHSSVSPAVVWGDVSCLQQAIGNLLQNAIKYTERGGVLASIDRDVDGSLALRVTDTGMGIYPEFLMRLGEPFRRDDRAIAKQIAGSGLGMALTKRYLELHGARLNVVSEPDRGSTFTVRFPASSEVAPAG